MFSGAIKEALSKFFRIEDLTEHVSGYIETRVALLKLEVREEVAKTLTRLMVLGVVALLGVFILIFISIGVALLINLGFDQHYIGFLIVGGFYLLVLLIALSFRKQIYLLLEKLLNNQLKQDKD